MSLGLGTAQFGLDYGISNTAGRTPPDEVACTLEAARRHGIHMLDTAPSYGDAELVLGDVLRGDSTFDIVTKVPSVSAHGEAIADAVKTSLHGSLARLGLVSVYGLIAHAADDLLGPSGQLVWDAMAALKREGLASRIGASVYTAAQIDALSRRYPLDLVQAPVSVLDQRLVVSGHLRRLRKAGVEVHARSILLQGLLLMDPASLSPRFEPMREHLRAYRAAMAAQGLSPAEAAIGFAAGLHDVDVVLVGVNSSTQLDELCASLQPLDADTMREWAIDDESILDPSLWGA